MPIRVPWLVLEPIVGHNFTAYKCLERKCGKHVEPKTAELWLAMNVCLQKHDIPYKRAILTITLSLGKLFNRFPSVLSPNVKNPASAIVKHANIEMAVE